MTEWVETIRKTKTSLMELELSIPGWIIIITFLYGLLSLYDSFVEIILNSRGKDVNGKMIESEFDEVCEKVLDRKRRQKIIVTDSNNTKALKAAVRAVNTTIKDNFNARKGKGGNKGNQSKCENCGGFYGDVDCWLAYPEKATQ